MNGVRSLVYAVDAHTLLAYIQVAAYCTIIETPTFTRRVMAALSEDEYRTLQLQLAKDATIGAVIRGSGGIRKLRWAGKGRGKRGGVRIIYYAAVAEQTVLMLFLFAKNETDDLTKEQLKLLAKVVKEEYP